MIENIVGRNVSECFAIAMMFIRNSKNQNWKRDNTYEYISPVCTTFKRSAERVIFIPGRNANPYFHFFETLWMMAGRNDVEFLMQFNKRIREFSNNGINFYGAYGHRLRRIWKDQLDEVVKLLIREPNTRRAVLSMWSPADLNFESKDIPCNTHIYFKIRSEKLDMTVCNRSNDIIWGLYGVNAVQFSTLQEVIAAVIEVSVGKYYHLSDSFHMYDNEQGNKLIKTEIVNYDPYRDGDCEPYPIVQNYTHWFNDLNIFFDFTSFWKRKEPVFINEWFQYVVYPIWMSWVYHKEENLKEAVSWIDTCVASDWRLSIKHWLLWRHKVNDTPDVKTEIGHIN